MLSWDCVHKIWPDELGWGPRPPDPSRLLTFSFLRANSPVLILISEGHRALTNRSFEILFLWNLFSLTSYWTMKCISNFDSQSVSLSQAQRLPLPVGENIWQKMFPLRTVLCQFLGGITKGQCTELSVLPRGVHVRLLSGEPRSPGCWRVTLRTFADRCLEWGASSSLTSSMQTAGPATLCSNYTTDKEGYWARGVTRVWLAFVINTNHLIIWTKYYIFLC